MVVGNLGVFSAIFPSSHFLAPQSPSRFWKPAASILFPYPFLAKVLHFPSSNSLPQPQFSRIGPFRPRVPFAQTLGAYVCQWTVVAAICSMVFQWFPSLSSSSIYSWPEERPQEERRSKGRESRCMYSYIWKRN